MANERFIWLVIDRYRTFLLESAQRWLNWTKVSVFIMETLQDRIKGSFKSEEYKIQRDKLIISFV